MDDKRAPERLGAVVSHYHGQGDPFAIKLVDALGKAVREMGRLFTAHKHQQEQARQHRRQQQQLRSHVIRQCAGNRRRQRSR